MGQKISKEKIVKSFAWQFSQNVFIQVASFVIQIILARILFPDDYGVLAIVLVFVNLANVFATSGYGQSLIQKKDSDILDFSTLFFFTLSLSIVLSLVLFFIAPLVANFYQRDALLALIRVSVVLIPMSSIISIQEAKLKIDLKFKTIFYVNVFALLVSWTTGIVLAYNGFGVWSLLIHQILYKAIIVFLYVFVSKLKIRFVFSFQRLKILLSFGSKLLIASLVVNVYEEIRGLVVAKKYSTEELGYFNRGKQFPMTIVSSINSSVQSVIYTVLSKQQDDLAAVKATHKKTIICSSFLVFPICVGLACVSIPLIKLLLTDKWLPASPFLIIFCAFYFLWPLRETSQQVMSAIGRSDLFLKAEVVQKIIGIAILFSTLFINVYAVGIGMIVDCVISTLINMYIVSRLIKYSVFEQLRDCFKSFLSSTLMGIIIVFLGSFISNDVLKLIVQVLCGACLYFAFSVAVNNEAIFLLKSIVKRNR